MRFLFFNHNVAWAGTFFRAFHIGRELAGRGHEVTVVTTRRTGRLGIERRTIDGVSLIETPDLLWGSARNGFDPWNTIQRILATSKEMADVVHAFDSRPVVILPALVVADRTGAALFTDWADWWGRGGTINDRSGWLVRTLVGPVETWFEEHYRGRAIGTTVISAALGHRAESLGVDPATILRVSHGCDVDRVKPRDRLTARVRLALGAETPIIAHLGALTEGDAGLLFDAVRIARNTNPSLVLVLIGNSRVSAPADLLRLGAIRETGFVSFEDMQDWLAASDAGVIPLRDTIGNRGRWPSKINDYWAAGRATIMTSVSDAAKVVAEHGLGSAVEPTALSFAAGIIDALKRGNGESGMRARAIAEKQYAWRHIVDRLEPFYLAGVERSRAIAQRRQ